MLSIRPTPFEHIQNWLVDYQKKSKNYEMPPENGQVIGIYNNDKLIGYFIVVTDPSQASIEINQGYLCPEARHKRNSALAMGELEKLGKKNGFKHIYLGTNRAVGSYIKFMSGMEYKLVRAIFHKEL